MNKNPKLIILAGPNGSGKSTLAELLKKNGTFSGFLNADTIASGLGQSLKSEIDSGRLLLKRMQTLFAESVDISFETTLSGKSWVKTIERAKSLGYSVELYFVYLDSINLAIERVAKRVSEGGHNINTETIVSCHDMQNILTK